MMENECQTRPRRKGMLQVARSDEQCLRALPSFLNSNALWNACDIGNASRTNANCERYDPLRKPSDKACAGGSVLLKIAVTFSCASYASLSMGHRVRRLPCLCLWLWAVAVPAMSMRLIRTAATPFEPKNDLIIYPLQSSYGKRAG